MDHYSINGISARILAAKTFIVPTPLNDPQPKEIHLYMKSTWRYDNMCLLEFLRKSTEEGKIAPWIKEAWKHQNHPETLEKFANEVCTDGEKVIACAMGSRLKDQFYGQWMMLNIPFRHYEELLRNDILEKIPDTDKFLAHCILSQRPQAKQMWSTPTTVLDDMKIEGCSQYHRTMVLNHINSQRELIYQCMAGNLKKANQQENQQPNTPISSIHHLKILNHYAQAIWWGTKTVEGRIWNGQMKNIKVGDRIHFGTFQVDVTQIQTYNSFRTMLTDVGYENAIPDVQNLEQAVQKYYSFKGYKTLEQQHGVVAFHIKVSTTEETLETNSKWNQQQRRWADLIRQDLQNSMAIYDAKNEQTIDEARDITWFNNYIRALEGF